MKDFINRNGARVLGMLLLIILFVTGFLIGRFGKSAPNIEVAEGRITKSTVEITDKEGNANEPEKTERIMTVIATGYCPCEICCGKSDGITATGVKAKAGRTIAVDPSVIPYGVEVIIDGHTYIAEDCGGVVKGYKIDIFFDTHEEALAFGKKQLTISVNGGD